MDLPGATIELRIIGTPIPKGRPRSRIVQPKEGKQFVSHYTPPNTKQWKKDILKQVTGCTPKSPWTGAIRCDREYLIPRPKCHKNTRYHIVKPDLDNIDKAFFDSLEGIIFKGDQQICAGIHSKRYANPGEEPGVIAIFTLLE